LEATAIKNGELCIRNANIPTILTGLRRWYDFEIIYVDGGKPDGLYSLQVPIGTPLTEIGHNLQKQGAHLDVIGKKITVFSH